MTDKSNILASLMARQKNSDKENNMVNNNIIGSNNSGTHRPMGLRDEHCDSHRQLQRPTSGASGRQHKLKQRFNVIRKLGKGTYGKVQLAINKETGQEVAIKTIKKTKIENEQDLQRVRREIQIMSSIEHPHIIHIYEVFENKDKIVLIMQYAPGGELYEYVSQSKVLDDAEARRLFRQISTAIYYCHQNKICHRDLKLENILLDEKNNAKLADFGLSNVFDKRRQLKTFCGSPLYASPEIVQGSPYEGPEVDCWSLGVLLYTLVYGAMPFDGSNFKRLVTQISESQYYEPQQRSQASPLIRRLLCADPTSRATILDICSDPWVNGVMAPPSPRLSPVISNQQSMHNSLLKVAQDMANLTPVRIDLLVALNPLSQPTTAQPDELDQKKPFVSPTGNNRESQKKPTIIDQTLEEDETRATSPIASYVVRNLSTIDSSMVPPTDKKAQKIQEESSIVAKVDPEIQESIPKEEVHMDVAQVEGEAEQDQMIVQTQATVINSEELSQPMETNEPVDDKVNSALTSELKQPDVVMDAEPTTDEQPKLESSTTAMDVEEKQEEMKPEEIKPEEVKLEEVKPEEVKPEGVKPEEVKPEGVKLEKEEEVATTSNTETEVKTMVEENQSPAKEETTNSEVIAEKPKKKKKIVVVKRKKRVSKKEALSNEAKDESAKSDRESSPENQRSTTPNDQKTKTKGPRKVKIPETFQAAPAEPVPPPKASLEGRRQSAMIADVSQKLLQQLQQTNTNGSAIISEDQAQLASVRVSDKKDEFERRASVITTVQDYATGKVFQMEGKEITEQPAVEPTRVEGKRESLNLGPSEHTIVEPVKAQQPMDIVLTLSPQTLSQSEPVTPTGTYLSEDLLRQQFEDKSKLTLDTSARDDRSDSAETIRADNVIDGSSASPQDPMDERIKIQGESAVKSRSLSSQESQPVVGPAPIARSYKKVTFTKDGTCITESGKIYSAQGDDGTVRRVERKSKVTHYPSDDGARKEASEETHEEIVYEGGSGRTWTAAHQSSASSMRQSGRPRPFEHLIMPSSDLFADGDGFGHSSIEDQHTFPRSSPFSSHRQSPRFGRADSASSCSSGSTDVFDDIFDTWTGATSMFDHNRVPFASHIGSLMNRAESPIIGSAFSGSRDRRGHSGGESAGIYEGQARCGSVEPASFGHRRRKRHQPGTSDTASGYDSDVPNERPASDSMRSARGPTFGSSNFFSPFSGRNESPLDSFFKGDPMFEPLGHRIEPFGDTLIRDLHQEHQSLKQRLAQHHKQLWKGSTPSLFTDTSHGPPPRPESETQTHPIKKQQSFRSSSGSQHSGLGSQKHQGIWVRYQPENEVPRSNESRADSKAQTHQSSSTSQIRQSIALDSAPIRRNTASLSDHLPPRQPVRKSESKNSLLNQLANMHIHQTQASSQEASSSRSAPRHTTASFIELKRTSSTSSNTATPMKHQQSGSLSTVLATSKMISTSGSSSAMWDDRVTPMTSSTDSRDTASRQVTDNPQNNVRDARIQSWLQDSAGNLSISSGSKSSTSDTAAAANELLMTQQRFLVAKSPAEEARQISKKHTSRLTISLSPQSPQGLTGTQIQQHIEQHNEQQSVAKSSQLSSSGSTAKMSHAKITLRQKSPNLDHEVVQQHQHVSESCSTTKIQSTSTTPLMSAGGPLQWIQKSEQMSGARLFEDIDVDSLSGSAADLESRSTSSSLLDQLRSRGYRSMINQRLVSTNQPAGEEIQQQFVTSTSSATSLADVGAAQQMTSQRIITTTTMTSSSSTGQTVGIVKTSSGTQENSSQPKELHYIPLQSNETKTDSAETQQVSDECSLQKQKGVQNEEPQINGTNGESGQTTSNEPDEDGDEEEEDEDVREAKANIKGYLDRVRETEQFLKSMHEEEENLEKKRQEMFLFNNLMFNTRLQNGGRTMRGVTTDDDSLTDLRSTRGCSAQPTRQWPQSAPINMYSDLSLGNSEHINGFIPPMSNYSPTIEPPTLGLSMRRPLRESFTSQSFGGNEPYRSAIHRHTDPLEPVQPLAMPSYKDKSYHIPTSTSPTFSWRRSKSQLGDQIEIRHSRRPLSMAIEPSSTFMADSNEDYLYTQPVRNKRSMSQVRYSSNRYSHHQPMMSEYKSSFGPNLIDDSRKLSPKPNPLHLNGLSDGSDNGCEDERRHQDSDDDMSSYRPQAYIPKVVPELNRGRDFRRRKLDSNLDATSSVLESSSGSPIRSKERRISLQLSNYRDPKTTDTSPITRRRSLTGCNEMSSSLYAPLAESSRLVELEQRIQANKKRREELLSGKTTCSPVRSQEATTRDEAKDEMDDENLDSAFERPAPRARAISPSSSNPITKSTGVQQQRPNRLTRPSRLESMEARIKRKSYCVRMSSPERKSRLLDKWSLNGTARNGSNVVGSSTRLTSESEQRKNSIGSLGEADKGQAESQLQLE